MSKLDPLSLNFLDLRMKFNPFKLNEISHSYKLDQYIFVLRVDSGILIFIQILIEFSVSK